MTSRQVSVAEVKAKCLRIINEMNRDGGTLTITKRGRPVAVLSPASASASASAADAETPPFIGMMRGTVLRYEEPCEAAASPSDWIQVESRLQEGYPVPVDAITASGRIRGERGRS